MENIMYQGTELLPIKRDIVFKAVFGKEENKDILAEFLSDVLDLDVILPKDITFNNTELSPNFNTDKLSRLDVRVKTAHNEHIDIEIQIADQKDIIHRTLYYLSRLY